MAQILVVRTAQNEQRALGASDQVSLRGAGAGGGSANDRSAQRQQGAKMVADICKAYGIVLARVRMEDAEYSDDEDDDVSALLAPTRRTGQTSHASAGRAARQAAQLDLEIAQIREAREQYMAALAAADGKRLEQAHLSGKDESELPAV